MLDTDTCSYIMRERSAELLQSMQARAEAGDDICISVVTYSELRLGAARSRARQKYDHLIDALSDRLDFMADWSTREADLFAGLQAGLMGKGTPIGTNDAMIAAHALSLDAVLVTNKPAPLFKGGWPGVGKLDNRRMIGNRNAWPKGGKRRTNHARRERKGTPQGAPI